MTSNMRHGLYKLSYYKFCVVYLVRVGRKRDLHRNCSCEWNSQVTRTRTEVVSVWAATIEMHAYSCLLETIYGYSDSHSCLCECSFSLAIKSICCLFLGEVFHWFPEDPYTRQWSCGSVRGIQRHFEEAHLLLPWHIMVDPLWLTYCLYSLHLLNCDTVSDFTFWLDLSQVDLT